ncbi:hypothetical protein BFW01_g6181 [Lasiodiplodia theobromae]|nr:hypothetical protein BFW01_g6181 [Lasiodiplodia theobromae]
MPFAAGLEQFGALGDLDWDEEFEDLVSTGPTIEDNLDADDAICTTDMSTRTTESELFSLEGDFDTNLDIVEPYQLAPTDEVMSAEDTIMEHTIHPASPCAESPVPLPLEEEHPNTSSASQTFHPGWSEETPSWYRHTATSPQVARWAVSPSIFNDITWTMNACKNDVVDNNIPRVSSCLLRAIQHVYTVPLDAGIGYPYGAYGEKFYERCLGPIYLFPRGAIGLKEPTDPDVPKDVYVPNGIKVHPPSADGQAFYPRPSPLRYVANIDDDQPPKSFQSAPSLVFLSGENYLDENVEMVDIEMGQPMETEEITIQEYEQESEQDGGEETEFSPEEITEFSSEDIVDFATEELIEAQFEIEINGGTLPSDIVDEDDVECFYASSEESRSWPSSPPLPSREHGSPFTIYEDETTCDLPELALPPHCKIPGLELTQDLDEGYGECGHELPELDDITTTLNGSEIDEAISRLESMSLVSLGDLLEFKRESDVSCTEYAPSTGGIPSTILPEALGKGADGSFDLTHPSPLDVDLSSVQGAQVVGHLNSTVNTDSGDAAFVVTSDQELAQKFHSKGLQGSSQVVEGGVGIATVVGAVCHTIWSICSANPLSVFLF